MKKLNLFLAILIIVSTITSCTHDDTVVDPSIAAYENANVVNGGIMYDKFWATESTFDQSNTNLTTISNSSNFFRCKQCHGWDGLGNNGAYINRAPKTSRPNVTGFNLYEQGAKISFQSCFSVQEVKLDEH